METVLLCLALGIPSLLALIAIDLGSHAPAMQRSRDYLLAAAGIFWDRPEASPRPHRVHAPHQEPVTPLVRRTQPATGKAPETDAEPAATAPVTP